MPALAANRHQRESSRRRPLAQQGCLRRRSDRFEWPSFEENTASGLCYASGTTGNLKGVLYTHRSTVLHAFASALPDSNDCSASDVILPVVPMYHVNAWGLPYVACMVGAKMVYPGPNLDGKSLYELFESEGVTLASGVPTIWQGLLSYMRDNGKRFSTLRRTGIGGSACPPSMIRTFQEDHVTNQGVVGSNPASRAINQGLARENQVLHVTVGPLWDQLSTGVY